MKKLLLVTILLGILSFGCQLDEEFEPSSQFSITKIPEVKVEKITDDLKDSNGATLISFSNSPLDKISEQFLLGTWKIKKLLGFNYIYNDASEYPKGQKVIGDDIILTKDLFSSEGITNYKWYQHSIKKPKIFIITVYSNAEVFLVQSKINRLEGNFGLHPNDIIRYIKITNDKNDLYPFSFYIVNNERLILQLEATYFELKKIQVK